MYSSRYVDHQTGPFGCIFPYPNFFGFQEISLICLEQQGLPISGGPVWPGGCTTGFYSGFSDGYSSPAYSVDSSSFLSGRFSSEGIRFRNSFSSYFPVYQTSSGPRLPYFLEKVSDTSFPRLPVFGGTLQDSFRSDFSPRGKISVTLSENSYFQQQSFSHGSTILSTTGLSEFSSRCGSSRSPSHSTSPVLSSGTLGLCFSSLGGSSTYSSCLTTSPRLVDSQGKCVDRCIFASPSSFSNSVYRFQSSRMGVFLEGKSVSGVWSLVQQQEHINLLEMRAVLLALQHFKTLLVSKAVVLATDNTTVVAYLQNQGGTRCHALFLLCKEILLCLLSHIHLVVGHIPGTFNVLADCNAPLVAHVVYLHKTCSKQNPNENTECYI